LSHRRWLADIQIIGSTIPDFCHVMANGSPIMESQIFLRGSSAAAPATKVLLHLLNISGMLHVRSNWHCYRLAGSFDSIIEHRTDLLQAISTTRGLQPRLVNWAGADNGRWRLAWMYHIVESWALTGAGHSNWQEWIDCLERCWAILTPVEPTSAVNVQRKYLYQPPELKSSRAHFAHL